MTVDFIVDIKNLGLGVILCVTQFRGISYTNQPTSQDERRTLNMYSRKVWKIVPLLLVLVMAFAVIAPAFAADDYKVVPGTIQYGKQGIYIAAGGNTATTVELAKTTTTYHPEGIFLRNPQLKVTFMRSNGESAKITASAYVYFNIGRAERDAWVAGKDKTLSIYVFDGSAWSKCPTWWANAGDYGRLVCRISKNGTYALGSEKYVSIYYNRPSTD
jgi:hypothetical protein